MWIRISLQDVVCFGRDIDFAPPWITVTDLAVVRLQRTPIFDQSGMFDEFEG